LCVHTERDRPAPLLKVHSFASDVSSDAAGRVGADICPRQLSEVPPQQRLTQNPFSSPLQLFPGWVEEWCWAHFSLFERAIQESSKVVNGKMPIRRIQSLPVQLLSFSPELRGQGPDPKRFGVFAPQTSGDGTPRRRTSPSMSTPGPQGGFEFKKPNKPASRCRLRSTHGVHFKEAFARRPNSAPRSW
ncbi:unnamed protein product, partial [Lota lota]